MTEKFRNLGYTFTKTGPKVRVDDYHHNIYAEVDAFLENGDCAMVVEVKVNLITDDITDYILQIEKIRKYTDVHNGKRRFFGAVAVTVIDRGVERMRKTGHFDQSKAW